MASITKRGEKWRVQVRRRGSRPQFKTFTKKVLASDKRAGEPADGIKNTRRSGSKSCAMKAIQPRFGNW